MGISPFGYCLYRTWVRDVQQLLNNKTNRSSITVRKDESLICEGIEKRF